jgi:energy-coupling factor transport system ATP-binding protein
MRLVPDNPIDLFDRESVAEECRAQDVRRDRERAEARGPKQNTRDILENLLGSSIDMNAHPRDLSTGQQRALAIALQLQSQPDYLLIDEPTRGLDSQARLELAGLLARVSARGVRVLIATHDRDFVRMMKATVTEMSGELVEAGTDALSAIFTPRGVLARRGVVAT